MYKRTDITVEMLHQLLEVDYDLGKLFWKRRPDGYPPWNGRYAGKEAFTSYLQGYRKGEIFNISFAAHIVIWSMDAGRWPRPKLVINHLNQVRDDNRLCNLEEATYQKNNQNLSMRNDNSSGHCGVTWSKKCQKWMARIQLNGKRIHLGVFTDIEDAIAARKKADKLYGFSDLHGAPAIP